MDRLPEPPSADEPACVETDPQVGACVPPELMWTCTSAGFRRLAINDTPVALIPGADHPSFLGLGLANASAITVALDRRTLLWLDYPVHRDFDLPASTQLARAHNSSVVSGAERFVYTHPDDEDPTAGLPLPRPPREYPEPSGIEQFANRDRPLEEVLKQIAGHDDRDPDVMIANYTWPFPGYEPPTLDDA